MTLTKAKEVADRYEASVMKIKGSTSTYFCCSFPYKMASPLVDFIDANFEVINQDNFSITFIL